MYSMRTSNSRCCCGVKWNEGKGRNDRVQHTDTIVGSCLIYQHPNRKWLPRSSVTLAGGATICNEKSRIFEFVMSIKSAQTRLDGSCWNVLAASLLSINKYLFLL